MKKKDIDKKAFEIFQRRMRGDIPAEEIDRCMREYGVIPNTVAAEEWMKKRDWDMAKKEIATEEQNIKKRKEEDEQRKEGLNIISLGRGVAVHKRFIARHSFELGGWAAIPIISGITFEEFSNVIIGDDSWRLGNNKDMTTIIVAIGRYEFHDVGGSSDDERKINTCYFFKFSSKKIYLPGSARIDGNEIFIPFFRYRAKKHNIRTETIEEKDKERYRSNGFDIYEVSEDEGGCVIYATKSRMEETRIEGEDRFEKDRKLNFSPNDSDIMLIKRTTYWGDTEYDNYCSWGR